jgi:tetratricopeptide (TPR) repeat protein
VKLRPLQGLRDKLLASLNNLHGSWEDAGGMHLSEPMSRTCDEIVLSRDTSACIRITESTLKTANSICARVSSGGSTRNLTLSEEISDPADSPGDTSGIQFGPNDGTSITLSTMTTFLDTYIQELNEEFQKGSYEKCKRYIQEALDWGEYRYLEYDVDFHQWFDLQLRLAEVYEKEGNFQDARKYIVFLRNSSDTNNLEYRKISNLQDVQLRCATARLFLREYERGHSKELDELKQQALNAFGAADALSRDASISGGGSTSVNLTVQQLLVGSALTLDKVYGILADTAGRRSLRMKHTILRDTLPQLDSTARSTRSAVPEPRTRLPVLSRISIPDTSPARRPSTSGSSEICTTSPLSPRTETTRPSETPDRETPENSQSRGLERIPPSETTYLRPVRREPNHAMNGNGTNFGVTAGDRVSRLFNAAKSHNLQLLQDDFSEFLPHINTRDEAGMNVLHHVLTTLGGEDDIKMLIRYGVDVNASDNHGDTPLHYCVRRNNVAGAKLLLRTKDVIIESANNSNQTPAQLVINQSGMYHTDMLGLLIKYKANFSWPGIPRDIDYSLRRLIQEVNASMRNETLSGRRDSRASESSHSSQHSRWVRAIGRNSSDS